MSTFDPNSIPPEIKKQAEAALVHFVEEKLGLTVERAASFVAESKAEAVAGDGETDTREDAIGKGRHYLRIEKHFEGAVDVLWPLIEPYWTALVDAAIAGGA